MELKVHVENTIRTVCGLNEETTVEDVIIALANSLKQTGKFYLCENRLQNSRIMSPDERLVQTLNKYKKFYEFDEEVNFILIKTKDELEEEESESESDKLIYKDLIKTIKNQQSLLEEQSSKLDKILTDIDKYEIINMNLMQENLKEIFKRKLLVLDLKQKINQKKLDKLESNIDDTSETSLNKEIELNQFLNAQHDYYKRKIDLAEKNLKKFFNQYEKLKYDFNYLIEHAPVGSLQEIDYFEYQNIDEFNMIKEHFLQNCNESIKQFELNRAKLNYLELGAYNLDKNLSIKKELIEDLENELNNLKKCEMNIDNISLYESLDDNEIIENNLISSSSSSEYLPNEETSKNDVNIYDSLRLPVKEFNHQRYSRIRKLNRYELNKTNNRNNVNSNKSLFEFDDVHYF